MSFSRLDVDEQLRWLQETRAAWSELKEGEVYLYPPTTSYNKTWMEVAFRALHYRVLLCVFVGPRGGIIEQVTVMDDRPKENELDHLFLVQDTEGSSKYSTGLITYKIGHGTKAEKMRRIKELLEEECAAAVRDPAAYAEKIGTFERTESEHHFMGEWRAGLPRT